MRLLKIAGLAVSGLIIVAAVLLLTGIPGSFIASTIETRVARDTGYRITVAGGTHIGLWPSLHVAMNEVSLRDSVGRETAAQINLDSVQADLPLRSLLSGTPRITELAIVRPVVRVPLLRERTRPANAAPKPAAGNPVRPSLTIDRITVSDGAVILFNTSDGVEDRIDGVGADIAIAPGRQIDAKGRASLSSQPVTFAIKATLPERLDRQAIPIALTLDAPGLVAQSINASAEVRFSGKMWMVNSLTGTLGNDPFNGWALADLTSKPLVKLDLDFQKLEIGSPSRRQAASSGFEASAPWSNRTFDLRGLNYADAQLRISAAQLGIGDARFAPAAADATLANGVLKATFAKLGAYGGEAEGDIMIDTSSNNPAYTLRCDLSGVRALPLLTGLAEFDSLDGKLQAKISVRASGSSQRAILSGLNGSVFVNVQDGEIRGINVAQMIRSLTTSTLSGWQSSTAQSTDLSQLAASFRIDNGQATTADLNLAGPLVRMTGTGTVDLASKALNFRVEPRLVMTLQGQGGASDQAGLGIPVAVQGPWSAPRFYPDMAGMLDNPDAAYAKLREMGKGLFGGSAAGGSTDPQASKLGEALGALIQQGIGAAGTMRGPAPATPAPNAPAAPSPATPTDDQSQTMNAIMKQLFGR
ncbi:AsmA family protein [soil metagenome]